MLISRLPEQSLANAQRRKSPRSTILHNRPSRPFEPDERDQREMKTNHAKIHGKLRFSVSLFAVCTVGKKDRTTCICRKGAVQSYETINAIAIAIPSDSTYDSTRNVGPGDIAARRSISVVGWPDDSPRVSFYCRVAFLRVSLSESLSPPKLTTGTKCVPTTAVVYFFARRNSHFGQFEFFARTGDFTAPSNDSSLPRHLLRHALLVSPRALSLSLFFFLSPFSSPPFFLFSSSLHRSFLFPSFVSSGIQSSSLSLVFFLRILRTLRLGARRVDTHLAGIELKVTILVVFKFVYSVNGRKKFKNKEFFLLLSFSTI